MDRAGGLGSPWTEPGGWAPRGQSRGGWAPRGQSWGLGSAGTELGAGLPVDRAGGWALLGQPAGCCAVRAALFLPDACPLASDHPFFLLAQGLPYAGKAPSLGNKCGVEWSC